MRTSAGAPESKQIHAENTAEIVRDWQSGGVASEREYDPKEDRRVSFGVVAQTMT